MLPCVQMRGFTIFLIFMQFYNKNILRFAKILATCGRFMIFHIEGYSNKGVLANREFDFLKIDVAVGVGPDDQVLCR